MRTIKTAALLVALGASTACPATDKNAGTHPTSVTSDAGAVTAATAGFRTVDQQLIDTQCGVIDRAELEASARAKNAEAEAARDEWKAVGATDVDGKQRWLTLYACAAELYKAFIAQTPASPSLYEMTFLTGEALRDGERYAAAIDHYRWVRDHRELGDEHFELAAASITDLYQTLAERAVEDGTIAAPHVVDLRYLRATVADMTPPYDEPIPQPFLDLQIAWDEYQDMVDSPTLASLMGENAARVSLLYFHFDDAIARFKKVIDKFCSHAVPGVVNARDAAAAIYGALGRFDELAALDNAYVKNGCGTPESRQAAEAENRGAGFRKASHLYSQAKQQENGALYEQAAAAFYDYYEGAPAGDADRPEALYDAANATLAAGKIDAALALFQEFVDNEEPPFRASSRYGASLARIGDIHFDKREHPAARGAYKELYEHSSKSGHEPMKLYALDKIARTFEQEGELAEAITWYLKSEAAETDEQRKSDALWSVAQLYKKLGNLKKLGATYQTWRRRYGEMPSQRDRHVRSFYDLAKAYTKAGKKKDAAEHKQRAIDAWNKTGSVKGSDGARWAGELALEAAEAHFLGTWSTFRLTKKTKDTAAAKQQIALLDAAFSAMQDEYDELAGYGIDAYTMAWHVRQGQASIMYGAKLREMPIPTDVAKLHAQNPDAGILDKWNEAIDHKVEPLQASAKKNWLFVVDAAKQTGVNTEWSKLALELLRENFPAEYAP